MVNRNAALHLLAVASVLLFSIVFIGYRLRDSSAAPAGDGEDGAVLALRPDSGVDAATRRLMTVNDGASVKPPVAMTPIATPGGLPDLDGGEAVPERVSMLRPGADNGASLFLPPPDMPGAPSGSIEESGSGASLKPPSDGEITGLVPAPGSGLSLPLPGMGAEAAPSPADDLAGGIPLLEARPGEEPEAAVDSSAFSGGGGLMLPIPSADAQNDRGPATGIAAVAAPAATAAPGDRPRRGGADGGGEVAEQFPEPPAGAAPSPDNAGSRTPPGRLTPPGQPDAGGIVRPAASSGPAGGGDGELRIYVISPGDTLSRIAARELGSISRADNIFLLNKDVIVDPNQLVVGTKIRLPVREQVQARREGDEEPAGPAILPGGTPRDLGGTNARIHTVAGGDTLSSISLRYYGSSAGWRFLYEANADVLPNPNQLAVGTELIIPPYGERAE